MICVEYYRVILYLRYHYLELISLGIAHSKWHTYFNFHIFRKTILWHINDHLRVLWSICLIKRNINCLLFSYSHTCNAIIKSLDHHSTTHFKLQRFATFRLVKSFTAIEATMIMYFYLISTFHLLHLV